ncbi:thioredoxin, partial [Kipferlia bialata]
FANWCGPCKALAPTLESCIREQGGLDFVAMDIDKNAELSWEYGVRSIPHVQMFKDGSKMDEFVGGQTRGRIMDLLASAE